MADDNDDSWLYGAGQEESQQAATEELEAEPVAENNGNLENKMFDTTGDEHNFEVS